MLCVLRETETAMSIGSIAAYIDTHGTFGTTIEDLCALLQPLVDNIMYVEENLSYSASMEEWKAMWAGKTVRLAEQPEGLGDDLKMWTLFDGRREVWVFREDAVNAVVSTTAK